MHARDALCRRIGQRREAPVGRLRRSWHCDTSGTYKAPGTVMTHEFISRRFCSQVLIRFAHCDPAGIIFFPQYLVLFNGLVEDWLNQALRHPYARMLGAERTGLPIVRLECDFRTGRNIPGGRDQAQ